MRIKFKLKRTCIYVIITAEKATATKWLTLYGVYETPPLPVKVKGGFSCPKALLTYHIHERQQCYNKQSKLHQIIKIILIIHSITSILCRVEVRATLFTVALGYCIISLALIQSDMRESCKFLSDACSAFKKITE